MSVPKRISIKGIFGDLQTWINKLLNVKHKNNVHNYVSIIFHLNLKYISNDNSYNHCF